MEKHKETQRYRTFASKGCCIKVPPMGCPTEMSPMVLETESPKPRSEQNWLLWEALRGLCSTAVLLLLGTAGNPCYSLVCGCNTRQSQPPSYMLVLSLGLSPSFKVTSHTAGRAHSKPVWSHLGSFHLQ